MRGMAYFLRVRTAMPSAETAMRATAAATTSLAPVEGFFWSSVLGVSSVRSGMMTMLPLEGGTVPGRAYHSASSRVNSIVSISLSSTNSTTLLGTTSSLGVQGVSAQFASAVSVAMQQVTKG